jgi:hypothetical protein
MNKSLSVQISQCAQHRCDDAIAMWCAPWAAGIVEDVF